MGVAPATAATPIIRKGKGMAEKNTKEVKANIGVCICPSCIKSGSCVTAKLNNVTACVSYSPIPVTEQLLALIQEAKQQIVIHKKPMLAVEALHAATYILTEKDSNHVSNL